VALELVAPGVEVVVVAPGVGVVLALGVVVVAPELFFAWLEDVVEAPADLNAPVAFRTWLRTFWFDCCSAVAARPSAG
jgi:hypothetical protein